MRKELRDALASTGFKYYQQGALYPLVDLPDVFVTYWTADSEAAASFDNTAAVTAWTIQIAVYGNQYYSLEKQFDAVCEKLKAKGFIQQGKGRDIPSDIKNYYGMACDFYYLENEGVV
jgi:hypothetical protein